MADTQPFKKKLSCNCLLVNLTIVFPVVEWFVLIYTVVEGQMIIS